MHKELKYRSPLVRRLKAKACCFVWGHCEGWWLSWARSWGPRGLPMGCQGRASCPGPVSPPKAKDSGTGSGWESLLCLPPARAQSRPGVSWGHWASPWGWRWAEAGQDWSCGPAAALLRQGLTALGGYKGVLGQGQETTLEAPKCNFLWWWPIQISVPIPPTSSIPNLQAGWIFHHKTSRLVKTRS